MNLEQTRELYLYLQSGELPWDCEIVNDTKPELSADSAFSVIYLLQEHFKVIPPYNKCPVCDELYDGSGAESESAMVFTDNGLEYITGVSTKTVKKYENYEFCSMECLIDFLRENNVD